MTDKTKKITCKECRGLGSSSAHVECEGGGFTQTEWAEQDYEFQEDYMAGRYDKRCTTCSGTGVITAKVHTNCTECGEPLSADILKAQEDQCSEKCWREAHNRWLEYNCKCGRCGWCLG